MAEIFEQSATQIDDLGDQPRVQATLRFTAMMAQASEIWDASLGSGNPQTASALGNLASIELALGRLEIAEQLNDQNIAAGRQFTDSINTINLIEGLSFKSILRARQGDRKGAEELLVEALDIVEQQLEPGHFKSSLYQHHLAARVYEHDTEKRLATDPESRGNRILLARCRLGLGRLDDREGQREDAQSQWRQAREIVRGLRSGSDDFNLRLLHSEILLELGDVDVARPMVEKILATGFRDPYYMEIFRRHGLGPPE